MIRRSEGLEKCSGVFELAKVSRPLMSHSSSERPVRTLRVNPLFAPLNTVQVPTTQVRTKHFESSQIQFMAFLAKLGSLDGHFDDACGTGLVVGYLATSKHELRLRSCFGHISFVTRNHGRFREIMSQCICTERCRPGGRFRDLKSISVLV